ISDTASTTAIPTMDIDRRARTPAEEKANAPGRARTSRYGWSIRPFSQRRPTSGHRIRPGAGGSGERGGHQVLRGLLHLREVLGRHERLRVHLVDVLGPGRPRREPCVLRGDLQPADGRTVSGRRRQPAGDLLAGERRRRNLARAELGQSGLLLAGGRRIDAGVPGPAEPLDQPGVQLRRRVPGACGDLRGQERQQDAVLVGGPDRPVLTQERRAGGLLAAEAHRAVQQAGHEPLEPDRHLEQAPAVVRGHPVDECGRHEGLAHRSPRGPAVARPAVQVVDRHREVVVGVHQARVRGDDPVPVGFKWFVPGLLDGSVGFGGEESAGASFLRQDGTVWTTDKDGILLALLASEITARTGHSPSQLHAGLVERFGRSWYARIDAPATREQKAALAKLRPDQVTASTLAGEEITGRLTTAPGNGAPIGGLKVTTENAWFAARPSGTEDVYKVYAESFVSAEHLAEVQQAAKDLVTASLA